MNTIILNLTTTNFMNLTIRLKRALMLTAVSAIAMASYAQSTVKGTVKDANGEPIVGVSVIVKGTGTGVITDIDGNYSIPNVKQGQSLTFSSIGFASQEIKIGGGKTTFNVTLSEDNKSLDEVVVIGYGTVKRRDLTGAVASVSGEKLAANPVSNVAEALAGQLPGVSVTSQDGRPGGTVSIRVRGGGSITQSNEPLYIVDGVQVSTIEDIAADNIESIDVLKDAASTAIYGARGANGVILITTKSGHEGTPTVKYNMYYQMKKIPEVLETLDAYDFVYNTWAYATAYNSKYGDGVAKYYGLGAQYGNHLDEYMNQSAHNYMEDVMQTSTSWNHDLSLSGGTAKTKYYTSVNYMDSEGIRINTGMSRWAANFKLDQQITKTLKANIDLRYTEMKFEGTKFDVSTSAYRYHPIDNPLGEKMEDGYPDSSGFGLGQQNVVPGTDPVSQINNYDAVTSRQRLRARFGLNWQVIKGLTANSELTLSRNWKESKTWSGPDKNFEAYSKAVLEKGDGYNVRWTSTLNYDFSEILKSEKHNLSMLLGNEVLASKSNTMSITGQDYPVEFGMDDAFGMINQTTTKYPDSHKYEIGTPDHTLSWFGRVNYSLLGRYLLTATFRADGSSKFAPNHRWGYFPAAAAAWRISDEPFMEGASEWLHNLKLRLSYGESGNDGINSSLWKETWKQSTEIKLGVTIPVFYPGEMMANPDLKWETTISRNVGLDFGFLGNKIYGSLDVYWNSTKNILMKVPCDASTGYFYQYQNVGETSNKGFELAIGADILRTKDWSVRVNATYNYNKNSIEKVNKNALADTNTDWGSTMKQPYYDYLIREGQPVGAIYGYQSAGWYTVDDFNYDPATKVWTLKPGVPDFGINTGYANPGLKPAEGQTAIPGMPKFVNQNPDEDNVVNSDDVTCIGEAMAKHTGGFNINARYKQIDFALGFTYQIGGKVYNGNAMHSMYGDKDTKLGTTRLAFVAEAWKYYDVQNGELVLCDTPESLAALNSNTAYPSYYNEYGIVNSMFVEDASYLRLNTLTIGYTFPKTWLKHVGLHNARVYFTGANLFCITGYSGLDPDINTKPGGNNGFPVPNYDYLSYPKARSFTFGLNVTF